MKKKFEGSPADKKKDKMEAKLHNEPLKKWENSAADKKMDRASQKKMDAKKKK